MCRAHASFRGMLSRKLLMKTLLSSIVWVFIYSLFITRLLQLNPTINTGYKRLNKIIIKFGTELKPAKHIVVNYNFTKSKRCNHKRNIKIYPESTWRMKSKEFIWGNILWKKFTVINTRIIYISQRFAYYIAWPSLMRGKHMLPIALIYLSFLIIIPVFSVNF